MSYIIYIFQNIEQAVKLVCDYKKRMSSFAKDKKSMVVNFEDLVDKNRVEKVLVDLLGFVGVPESDRHGMVAKAVDEVFVKGEC